MFFVWYIHQLEICILSETIDDYRLLELKRGKARRSGRYEINASFKTRGEEEKGEGFHLSSNDFCILNSPLTRLGTGRYALDYLGTTGYRHCYRHQKRPAKGIQGGVVIPSA